MAVVGMKKQDAIDLLEGIIAGDGDIYGRMVNEQGKAAYPEHIAPVASMLYESLDPSSPIFGNGQSILSDFLASYSFID